MEQEVEVTMKERTERQHSLKVEERCSQVKECAKPEEPGKTKKEIFLNPIERKASLPTHGL